MDEDEDDEDEGVYSPTHAPLHNPSHLSLRSPQVAAYCNGRDSVTEFDVMLLQHVLWQRPEHCDKIADWVLSQLSADDGTKQVRCAHALSQHPQPACIAAACSAAGR